MCIPTDKQIRVADKIAEALELDFPTGSPDFNKKAYWKFINNHIDEYLDLFSDSFYDDYDDEMAWYDPWAEGGY